MTLTPCDRSTASDWIKAATNVPATDGTVARLVPDGFEAYVQILHSIHLEPGVETLRDVEFAGVESQARAAADAIIASLGRGLPAGATIGRSRHGGSREHRRGKRVRWRELAEFLGRDLVAPASFERDLWDGITGDWPDELDGPVEGSLTSTECHELAAALEPFTHSEVTYWYGWENTMGWTGLCRVGSLREMRALLALDEVTGSPEYWWHSDRSWIVHTNVDLSYTLVAGTRTVIDALLRNPALECFELRSDTRLWPPSDQLRQPLA